ncbi:ER membrane protein complex subunit 7 homolog [Drosophila innubila]|uniref:ER membrane protein complex subunit 7 homolog n=1 Tax=Drosophila innubila TaxID=198719 RepID=UPI00148CD233|nr:ER membrane protein complex subunit 7 homolog [Drosophila innubila]
MLKNAVIFLVVSSLLGLSTSQVEDNELITENIADELHTIEGLILPPNPELHVGKKWPADITVSVNGGEYLGFVRQDGNFVVSGVPSGSYVLEAQHPDIYFQPVLVDISYKGNFRARKLSHIRPNQVVKLPYPLYLKPIRRHRYFRIREQWNIMDYVLNPMVLLMVVPLVLMLLLPRLINDPETKREIENIQFPKIPTVVPDFGDMLTSFLAGKRSPEKQKKASTGIPNRKRN